MVPEVKICGLSRCRDVDAAIAGGAVWIGFVLYPPSPRHVGIDELACLSEHAGRRCQRVGVFVDPDDASLFKTVAHLDWIQLHGGETPARVADVKARFGKPVIKAIKLAGVQDLEVVPAYADIADRLLFDAKPPADSDIPGGHGRPFDWALLKNAPISAPWLLSGGLTPETVGQAMSESGAAGLDVSSGVEAERGVKSSARITEFLDRVRWHADQGASQDGDDDAR